LLYTGAAGDGETELRTRAIAAGWECTGSASTLMACRKAGAEVTVMIKSVDESDYVMFVTAEPPRR